MPVVTIPDVDEKTLMRLEAQALRKGRSLETELREILDEAAKPTLKEMRERFDRLRREHFGDRVLSDSVELLREDRER